MTELLFFSTFAHCRLLPIKTDVTVICNYCVPITTLEQVSRQRIVSNSWCCLRDSITIRSSSSACVVRIVNPNCCLLDNCYIFRSYGRVFPRKSRGGRGERGGSSHIVICDLMRRYGCRTSSSSGREKVVDDRQIDRQNTTTTTGEDNFFVWPSSLDHLTFDLLSIGNGPAAVPFSHGRKFLLPLLQGRGD